MRETASSYLKSLGSWGVGLACVLIAGATAFALTDPPKKGGAKSATPSSNANVPNATLTPPVAAPPGTEPHAGAPGGLAPADAAKYLNGLPDRQGYVSWKTLADVKVKREKDRMVPTFPAPVVKLNAQTVKLQGFMVPLDQTSPTMQKHFVLTPLPQSCSFCLPPIGMEGIIEVRAKTAVKFSYEPVQVAGKFEVLSADPLGIYYRLSDAEPVK